MLFQDGPHWMDYVLFYEYFHGDNGAGLGASHQAGWTALIARLIDLFARASAADWLSSPAAIWRQRRRSERSPGS
jgi:hypothetical protein